MSASIDIAHLMGLCETAIFVSSDAENKTNENTIRVQATETNISSSIFSLNSDYAEGEYTMWNNRLYLCLHDCKGVEPSNGNFWKEANLAEELNKIVCTLKEGK